MLFMHSHHKYAERKTLVHVKEAAQYRARNLLTEGALGRPNVMGERKGTSGATV